MRSIFIFILLISQSFFGYAQTVKDVQKALQSFAADKDLKNASIGFFAIDVDSNQVIAGISPNKSLVPASTMKLITTATSLELMSAGKRFSTTVNYSGEIDTLNCTLNGNIYIVGGGDPCLGSFRFDDYYGNFIEKWATEILNLGIDSINGRVIADARIFSEQMIPSTWIWADLGNYYGAGPSGLSIYENLCRLTLTSGNKGEEAHIECVSPVIPDLEFVSNVKSQNIKKDQSYIFGAPYQNKRVIKGAIPIHQNDFEVKGSIPDPAYLTAFELDMKLREKGIKLNNPASTIRKIVMTNPEFPSEDKKLIMVTRSPRLVTIIEYTNHYSVNLYAEHLMNHIGIFKYGSGDTGSGAQATVEFWQSKGMNTDGFYVSDGSGLSRFNAITPRHFTTILKYMYDSKNYQTFLNTLPIAGKSGTLKYVCKGTVASGRIRAKSGSMTRIKSYAGYVKTLNNRNIAFAIMVNNYNCSAYEMKMKMQKIMVKLAAIKY